MQSFKNILGTDVVSVDALTYADNLEDSEIGSGLVRFAIARQVCAS